MRDLIALFKHEKYRRDREIFLKVLCDYIQVANKTYGQKHKNAVANRDWQRSYL